MANRYCNLVGSKLIKDDFQNINVGFNRVEAEIDRVNTNVDQVRVDTENAITNIRNDVSTNNTNVNNVIDNLKNNVDLQVSIIKNDMNNISFTGSSHDPLVTGALVDIDGENFGPNGNQRYLDGRLEKWEKRQPIQSETQPDQPDGGIWYEILSDDGSSTNTNGLYIKNMIVQDDEPEDKSVIWGDT